MQKKPISTTTFTFENLIEAGALYVDKTQYFYKLITDVNKCYFCSRPRRFGKSLAVSILKNIFLGKKELFKGLYIDGMDYNWEVFPVIHIDVSRCNSLTPKNLEISIHETLLEIARHYDVKFSENGILSLEFDTLISALREKTGKKVVILIDEYDHPLVENLDNAEKLEQLRAILESFYQIIKVQEPNERFVFMTGITKFNKVSIFSKLNNLNDITMTRDYACMFGYTQEELENNFAPYIDDYVQEEKIDKNKFVAEIKRWYNGFRFEYDADTVYNPVSVGQFFNNDCKFKNYWFSTATPTFITKLAKNQRLERKDIENEVLSDASLNAFNVTNFAAGKISKERLITLLFQTGYLTIDKKLDLEDYAFTLRFPNYEVESSFEKILFEAYIGLESEIADSYVLKIKQAAYTANTDRMIELFQNFLAEVPYTIQVPEEKYYQTVIFCILKMCGMEIEAETATNKGRIDAVLNTPNSIYIFEFKINQSAEIAVEQIMQREYFQKFIEKARADGKTIRCFGMNFSTEEKNITDWKMA